MGFKAGTGIGHQLVNRSTESVTFIEVGDRTLADKGGYPNDDMKAELAEDGSWIIMHKDGTLY